MSNVDPVESQLNAYNERDVDRFMANFAEDVRMENGTGEVICSDFESMRERYAAAFVREPMVRCQILARVRHGDYVVDHEHLTGFQNGSSRFAVVIYRLRGAQIAHVRILES